MIEEGWGSHLGEHTAIGTWSLPEAGYTLNYLELRRSFSPSRIPRPLVEQYCCHNYRQHNSGCLYEERGGVKSGPLRAQLWRILTWYSRKRVTVARHMGHLGQVEKLQDYPCRGITLLPSGPTRLVLGSLNHVKSDSLVPVQPALSTI